MQTVKFWINAFIQPASVDGPPGAGLLFNYHRFSGDGRNYDSAIHASSRMHSEVEIVGCNTASPSISFQWHNCDDSHAMDENGTVVDTKKGECRGHFTDLTVDHPQVKIHYAGAASMPLLSLSPDIDANGWFGIDINTGHAWYQGMIDSFPWFEAYVAVNNGAPHTLFHADPTGSGPESLVGNASRSTSGQVNTL